MGRIVPACGISRLIIDSSVHSHDCLVHQAHTAQEGKILRLYAIMLTIVKKKTEPGLAAQPSSPRCADGFARLVAVYNGRSYTSCSMPTTHFAESPSCEFSCYSRFRRMPTPPGARALSASNA